MDHVTSAVSKDHSLFFLHPPFSQSLPKQLQREQATNLNNENSQQYNNTYPECNENFFLPHGHPNCLSILNAWNQRKRGKVTLHYNPRYLNTYNSCHPQKPATTAALTHPGAQGTRPTSGQHSNTLHRSPGAVAKGRRCQHMFIPLRWSLCPKQARYFNPYRILLGNASH